MDARMLRILVGLGTGAVIGLVLWVAGLDWFLALAVGAIAGDAVYAVLAKIQTGDWAPLRLAEALPADVVGDRDQPVLRVPRALAPLVRAIGVQERRLRHVLGVRGLPQHRERVAVDVADVPPVDPLEGPVRTQLLRQKRRHIF